MNEQDFRACVAREYDGIYRFSYRMLGAREAAQDVTQEAFLRLAGGALADGGTPARRWLYTVARNLCIDELRRRTRMASAEGNSALTTATRPDQNETAAAVAAAVASLEAEHREVIVLREYEGLSYADIALVIGCPEGTVKSRIARGRERLRELLKDFMEARA